MSIFKREPFYSWTPHTRDAAEKLFGEMESWPDVIVATELRRPCAM